MKQRVFQEFNRIVSQQAPEFKGRALEIGAVPRPNTLLKLPALKNAKKKIGLNILDPLEYDDFAIIKGNANNMNMFEDASFELVLCNAVLEHDKFFWKSIHEMKRVLTPGGLLVICNPGYTKLPWEHGFWRKITKHIPIIKILGHSTLVFRVHASPGDYYRYSPQAFREVFFEKLNEINVYSIMVPPRVIGHARKPY